MSVNLTKNILLSAGFVLTVFGSAHAQPNLITNGDFTQTGNQYGRTASTADPAGPTGRISYGISLGWNMAAGPGPGYNHDVAEIIPGGSNNAPGVAPIPGDPVADPAHTFTIYGNNGYTPPPGGGNLAVLDGDPTYSAYLYQTLNTLTVGSKYTLKFNYASGQENGFSGATTENVTVGLTTDTVTQLDGFAHPHGNGAGPVLSGENITLSGTGAFQSTPNHGFNGWYSLSYTFTAVAST